MRYYFLVVPGTGRQLLHDIWRTGNGNVSLHYSPYTGISLLCHLARIPPPQIRDSGRLDTGLGSHPQDIPDIFIFSSPPAHVYPGCPPTLLFHGNHDVLIPVKAPCALHPERVESNVSAIKVVFPWTDLGIFIALPQVNPAAQLALNDLVFVRKSLPCDWRNGENLRLFAFKLPVEG